MSNHPSFTDSVMDLFSLTGLIAFLGGMLAQYLWCWAKDRWRDRKDPDNAPHRTAFRSLLLLWMLIFVVVGYMGVKQQRLADETTRCEREFQQQLTAQIDAQTTYSRENTSQLEALSGWFHDALFPPAEIAHIRATNPNWQNDPVYLRWALDMTNEHAKVIDAAQARQQEADEQRARNPLPKPTCGVR